MACSSATPAPEPAPKAKPPLVPKVQPKPAPVPEQLVRVTVVSAEIKGRMANGNQWDDGKSGGAATAGPLKKYFLQHGELVAQIDTTGIPVTAEDSAEAAYKSEGADPMVIIEVGDTVFRSPMRPRAFNPIWNHRFQFALASPTEPRAKAIDRNVVVRIHVVDWDGPVAFDAIGTTVMSVSELVGANVHKLGPFGQVKNLTLQVQQTPLPEAKRRGVTKRLAVAGRALWTDTQLDLIAGQRVVIEAADEVCTHKKKNQYCVGPEGHRTRRAGHAKGFYGVPHGALIATVGDTRFAVRRRLEMIAPSSGRLYLGVNDDKPSDNKGAFAARIVVYPVP